MSDDPPGQGWANLGMEEAPTPFTSPVQRARVLTEGWAARWMFCPECGTAPLDPFPNNSKVADFRCAACDEEYELKAQKGRFGPMVMDGAYGAMLERLKASNNPNLVLMNYDPGTQELRSLGGGIRTCILARGRSPTKPRNPPANIVLAGAA